MNRYLLRRGVLLGPQLLILLVLSFGLVHLTPGATGAVDLNAVSGENLEQMRERLGLDRPLPVQFADWLWDAARLDFGDSFMDGQPVREKIFDRLPATMLLTGTALVMSLVLAIPLGVVSSLYRNSSADYGLTVFAFLGVSIPAFWAAIVVIIVFGVQLDWFPIQGMESVGRPVGSQFLDVAHHLVLPATVLGLEGTAALTRLVRSSMTDVLVEDYVRTARSKGLAERAVLYRHALKNALLPMVTLVGLRLPTLIGGAVIIETVFAWPGIGRLGWESVLQRDYPVVMGLVVFTGVLTILGNLLADITYAAIDPRIKLDH
ncbi:MAG TPA: ABC transporter permease [Thermomicrobiales bacterium]|jgi:peptide/nickel transport system permease protein|nr:ABC transporter permease [Thermomicrobiales bacterium]